MRFKSVSGVAPLVVGAMLAAATGAQGAVYSFAGFSWDQDNTPDQAGLLGGGVTLGGAVFSSGTATNAGVSSTTLNNGFPSSNVGFNRDLTLGRLTGLATTPNTTRFVNLPAGDNGLATRHGVESSWSGGRMLPNGVGDDFVLYESASSSTQVENPMLRVRLAGTSSFSDWYYFVPDAFATYGGGAGPEGTMATGYDLSSFGLGAGVAIDLIQIANLIDSDRIDVPVGTATHAQGRVVPNSGSALLARPNGSMTGTATYGSGTLDPDPLYVGIMQPLVIPEPAAGAVIAMGAAGLLMRRRSRSL